MKYEYWRERQVREKTQLSRSTRWRLEREGKFPARRQLSSNSVGWLRCEVEDWLSSRKPAISVKGVQS